MAKEKIVLSSKFYLTQRRKEIQECCFYVLEKFLEVACIAISVFAIIVVWHMEMELSKLEGNINIPSLEDIKEYVPIELGAKLYIQSLPLSVDDIEEVVEVETVELSSAMKEVIVDEYELEVLAQAIWAEESIFYTKDFDSDPEKVERVFKLCGSVILRRTEIGLFGATLIEETIFAVDNKGRIQYAIETQQKVQEHQKNIPIEVYQWAQDLLVDGPIGPRGLIFQSQFEQGDEVYAQIGNQYFCVKNRYNQ